MTAKPKLLENVGDTDPLPMTLSHLLEIMEIKPPSSDNYPASLPFSPRDVTAGVENEFQTVVRGEKQDIDLAIAIETSSYYKNLIRRTASGIRRGSIYC